MAQLLILEDNLQRIESFREVAPQLDIGEPMIWSNATEMIVALNERLQDARLISLDHDLYPRENDATVDAGDGLMVAKALAGAEPRCPVIIHSSNAIRADWMQGELEAAGWRATRILPFGDDWLTREWVTVAKNLLAEQ